MFIAPQPHLSFYAMGRTSGIVLEIGDAVTQTYPVIEGESKFNFLFLKIVSMLLGHQVPRAIQRLDMGGRDLTTRLAKLLMERNFCFASTAGQEIVRDMKEKHGYVALDFEQELKKSERSIGQKYKLPDGETITLAQERFKCPEALFNPQLLGYQSPGITRLLYNAIMACEMDFRKDLFCNMILTGGKRRFPNNESSIERRPPFCRKFTLSRFG